MFSKRYSASSPPRSSDPQTGAGGQFDSPQSTESETFHTVGTQRTPRNSVAPPPPRYSNLSSLASDIAERINEAEIRADAIHDGMSFISLESNTTTPTYRTLPAGHSDGMQSTFRASTATIPNPPRYSSMSHRYSAAAPREFEFAVRSGGLGPKGQPWAILKLYNAESRRGKGGNHPRFYEGENIFGQVELFLLGHTIKNVKLVLKGTIITSAMDSGSVTFLEQTYTIWDRSFGDPRQPQPEEKFDGKLEGDYVFPFSIPFPKYVKSSNLEAVQANGQPVESQIQLTPQGAGLGGRISAFPTANPLQKNLADYHDEGTIGEASSNPDIAHSHVDSFPPEKVSLASRIEPVLRQSHLTPFHLDSPSPTPGASSSPALPLAARIEPVLGQFHITPFHLDPPSSTSVASSSPALPLAARTEPVLGQFHITPFYLDPPSPPSGASSFPAPGSEPGPSAISPYTYSQEDPPRSTSKETSRRGSRWSFSKSAFTSASDSQKKRRFSIASSLRAAEPDFGSHLLPLASLGSPSSVHNPGPANQLPALKSTIPAVLPQSFLERDVKANTKYELTLVISHGRFSSSSKVRTTIVYNRATIPPPMPRDRRDAYQERQTLPRPTVNLGVWHQLPTIPVRGTFLQQRELKADYTLSLANPLSYARGTVIPCYLTIACDNISALNLFANPRSPRVRLRRVVRYLDTTGGSRDTISPGLGSYHGPTIPGKMVVPQASTGVFVSHIGQAQQDPASNAKRERKIQQQKQRTSSGDDRFHGGPSFQAHGGPSFQGLTAGLGLHAIGDLEYDVPQDDGTEVSNAVWWISKESGEGGEVAKESVRTLQGEVHLPPDLQPSCPFPLFNISYRVELLAPVSHAFEPEVGITDKRASDSAQKSRVYASQFVEITTGSRDDEPDVIAFTTPPGRSAVSRARPTDVMGSLLPESEFM